VDATETVRLLALVTRLWPWAQLQVGTPQAWQLAMDDLPYALVEQALLAVARTEQRPPTVATLRHQVAATAGLLAPDEDVAWGLALAVASKEGVGRKHLPGPVAEAYDTVGGAHGMTMQGAPATVRAQYRDAYRAARDRHDRALLAGDLAGPLLQLEAGP
jgi:hypothetical protein